MPLQDNMQIVSVDDHLIEHRRVFTDRLAAKFLEDGPRIVEDEQGRHLWHFEDKVFPYIGLNAVAGKKPEEYGMEPLRFDDMIPGCYDPAQRIKDMDADGVQATACFPSFPGFHASAKALRPNYNGGQFQSVSARLGGNADVQDGDSPSIATFVVYATNLMWSAVELVFSGQLQKHPRLKFMLAEGGIGWFPYVMERLDSMWERHRYYQPVDFDTRPTDLFKKHFWGCFINDDFGIKNRHEIGIDRICVEIDYPHVDCNWPNSRKILAQSLRDVSDEDVHKIVELNAREALNFLRV